MNFTGFKVKDWAFYSSVMSMSSDKLMDQLSDKVGIMHLPEVVYGSNYLYVSNPNFNVILDFNAVDCLSLSGYEIRSLFLNPKTGVNLFKLENKAEPVAEPNMSISNLMPEKIITPIDVKNIEFNVIDVIPV